MKVREEGNWGVSSTGFARCTFYRGKRTGGQTYVVNKALDVIATTEGDTQEEAEANAKLIAAAANACKAVNPDNPRAVAQNIKGMVTALTAIASCGGDYPCDVVAIAQQALAKVTEEKC